MKEEVKQGLIWSIFSIILSALCSYLLVYVVKTFDGYLYWFSYLVFTFGFLHLLFWALIKFKDDSQILNKKYFYETNDKIKKELKERQKTRQKTFLYAFLFNMLVYTVLYLISLI